MTYIVSDILPSLGFVQASAVSSATCEDVVFDIDNNMSTTVANGKTDLKAQSIVVMALSRDNDGDNSRIVVYASDSTIGNTNEQIRFWATLRSETTNYFQSSEFTFAYSDNIEPIQKAAAGTGNVNFNNYSHAKIWRLSK